MSWKQEPVLGFSAKEIPKANDDCFWPRNSRSRRAVPKPTLREKTLAFTRDQTVPKSSA